MTKLDQQFVSQIRVEHGHTLEAFDAMVREVERLEAIVAEAVRIIRQGKAQFAPHTTNSDADAFLARNG